MLVKLKSVERVDIEQAARGQIVFNLLGDLVPAVMNIIINDHQAAIIFPRDGNRPAIRDRVRSRDPYGTFGEAVLEVNPFSAVPPVDPQFLKADLAFRSGNDLGLTVESSHGVHAILLSGRQFQFPGLWNEVTYFGSWQLSVAVGDQRIVVAEKQA